MQNKTLKCVVFYKPTRHEYEATQGHHKAEQIHEYFSTREIIVLSAKKSLF
jgi:hypothetical protein